MRTSPTHQRNPAEAERSAIKHTSIVFQAFIGDEDTPRNLADQRLSYIRRQIEILDNLKKRHNFQGHHFLVATAPTYLDPQIIQLCFDFGLSLTPIGINRRNKFEYPGFAAMQAIAAINTNESAILYCHSKGSVNFHKNSLGIFKFHTSTLFSTQPESTFQNPEIQKIGLFPSRHGWLWHNFFWVRSSYLALKKFRESDNRYYYESAIGDHTNDFGYLKCHSPLSTVTELRGFQHKSFYEPSDLNANPALVRQYDLFSRNQ